MNEGEINLEAPRRDCKELLRALEMSSKFAFKNDTEQSKYAKSLSIFLDQYTELEKEYFKLKENKWN